jgi:hypothetical protein
MKLSKCCQRRNDTNLEIYYCHQCHHQTFDFLSAKMTPIKANVKPLLVLNDNRTPAKIMKHGSRRFYDISTERTPLVPDKLKGNHKLRF